LSNGSMTTRTAAIGARAGKALETSRVLNMLGGRQSYQRFIQEGLRDRHREEYYAVKDQRFLGEERFIEKLKARVDGEPETVRFKKTAMIAFSARCASA
jgi:hypothetical protein